MSYPEMPPSKLSELVGDRSHFTTEEIIQIASQLADGESIDCGVKITPVVLLSVHLDNKNSANVPVNFRVMNPKHMRCDLVLDVNYHSIRYHSSIQRARIGGRPRGTLPKLNLTVEDVINIFDLGDSVVWYIHGHGALGANVGSRQESQWW